MASISLEKQTSSLFLTSYLDLYLKNADQNKMFSVDENKQKYEKFFDLFSRCAVGHLIHRSDKQVPELYDRSKIEECRRLYQSLDRDQIDSYHFSLWNEDETRARSVDDLLEKTMKISSEALQSNRMPAVIKIADHERMKYDEILQNIRLEDEPRGLETQHRAVLVSILKMGPSSYPPLNFSSSEWLEKAQPLYQKLTRQDQEAFERFFVSDDSQFIGIREIRARFPDRETADTVDNLCYALGKVESEYPIPVHNLSKIAWKHRQINL